MKERENQVVKKAKTAQGGSRRLVSNAVVNKTLSSSIVVYIHNVANATHKRQLECVAGICSKATKGHIYYQDNTLSHPLMLYYIEIFGVVFYGCSKLNIVWRELRFIIIIEQDLIAHL